MNNCILVVLLLFVSLLFSCSNKSDIIRPEVKNITESVYASGAIKSENQYEVHGKVNGPIEKVFVGEGSLVKKGDPIFQLDNKNLKIATENARLASVAADFSVNENKLLDAKKAIDLAKKKLTNDSLLYLRQRKLWGKSIGTKVTLEKRQLDYENAQLNLATAHTNYEEIKRQLELQSEQSKNNLEIAKLLENDYIIKSEVDGVVYKVNREEGDLINGSEAAAVIGGDDFLIELNIDELDRVKVKIGQRVFIRMDSYQSQVFEAEIVAIDPMMDTRTRSFQADAKFTKRPAQLFPNLTVEASILIQTKEEVLTIPRNYLRNDSSVILEGGELQSVETGLMDYDLVEIKDGIDSNTRIELPE